MDFIDLFCNRNRCLWIAPYTPLLPKFDAPKDAEPRAFYESPTSLFFTASLAVNTDQAIDDQTRQDSEYHDYDLQVVFSYLQLT